jgi:starch synthase
MFAPIDRRIAISASSVGARQRLRASRYRSWTPKDAASRLSSAFVVRGSGLDSSDSPDRRIGGGSVAAIVAVPVRILFVVSEVAPFSKTGGLADVAAALPPAMAALGHRVMLVTPKYRGVDPAAAPDDGVERVFVDRPEYFDRPGLYGEGGSDYPDNDVRFGFLCEEAFRVAAARRFLPEVVHLHDWQTALAAYLVHRARAEAPARRGPATVFTVHNLAYQGLFGRDTLARLGLPSQLFTHDLLEFHGMVSLMKAGLVFADAVTTVSPTYAHEIQTPEFGHGLDGVLRVRAARGEVFGILNGADYGRWSPENDGLIPARYSAARLSGKARDKAALQHRTALDVEPDTPILGVVSRLDHQKGIDLIADAAAELTAIGVQLVVLGSGDPVLDARLAELAIEHPGRIHASIQFDDPLAHQIQAGSDMFVVPSRWEPCGLTQMYALRYGTVPLVTAVGGLEDTVEDGVTGFKMPHLSTAAAQRAALVRMTRTAVGLYRADRAAWRRMMRRGMAKDFSWESSARRYEELFRSVVRHRRTAAPSATPAPA